MSKRILPMAVVLQSLIAIQTPAQEVRPAEGAGVLDSVVMQGIEDSLYLTPNDPDGHLQLSDRFYKQGYKTPTLLALCRFLVLEPDSPRSEAALRQVGLVMQKTAGKPLVGGGISFERDPKVTLDEGDFTTVDIALTVIGVRLAPKLNKDKIDSQSIIEELKVLLAVLSQSKSDKPTSGFAWNYYRPYFVEIKNRHYEEAFCYYIAQSAKTYETRSWLAQHSRKIDEFRAWSATYKWREKIK